MLLAGGPGLALVLKPIPVTATEAAAFKRDIIAFQPAIGKLGKA